MKKVVVSVTCPECGFTFLYDTKRGQAVWSDKGEVE